MIITSIERQKKNSSRRSLFLDGAFVAGISEDIMVRFGLFVGKEVSSEEIKSIETAESEQSVKSAAMRFRSYRPRSEKEVQDHLKKKGFAPSMIDLGLRYLESQKLLDDEEFARMLCRDALHLRPIGKLAMRNKLFKKGIPKEIIERTIESLYSVDIEKGLALKEAEKKMKRLGSVPPFNAKRKLYEHLMRRGYDSSVSRSIVNQLIR